MNDITLGQAQYHLRGGLLFDAANQPVALRAKSAHFLEVLVEHRGQVLSKDLLAAAVWPGLIATDESISQCVSDIRKALGDNSHTILQTYPKRGYRLTVGAEAQATGFEKGKRQLVQLLPFGLSGLLLLVIVLGLMLAWFWPRVMPLAAPLRNIIAVLPFENLTEAPEADYLATGFSDDLTIHLSELSALRVMPSSAVRSAYSVQNLPNVIAQKLGSRFLVAGALRMEGAELRINVQLIDGEDGTNVWAGKYIGGREALLSNRSEILQGLAEAMSLALTKRELRRLTGPQTTSVAAYEEVLMGRRAISTFSYADNLTAERHFRRAINLDRNYATAYAELAAAFAIRLENGWDLLSRADEEKAFYFANKAIELDPELWLAHYALGRLQTVLMSPDMDAAEKHLTKAMSLQPYNDDARAYFADVLIFKGEAEASLPLHQEVLSSHPYPPFWYYLGLGHAHYSIGNNDAAADALAQCLRQLPTAPYCLRYQIANFAELDQLDDAAWAAEEYAALGHVPSISAIMALLKDQSPTQRARIAAAFRKAGLED